MLKKSPTGTTSGRRATTTDDLASWSYQAPTMVAQTVVSRHPEAGSALDVGCGTGLVGRALRARGFAGQILGLDVSQASREIAQHCGAYDSVEHADLQQRLPLEDDSVDAVVCVGVMTYLPEVEAVWREFARVARSGGLVVATQREDLWHTRRCQAVIDRLQNEGVWTPLEITGPAPHLRRPSLVDQEPQHGFDHQVSSPAPRAWSSGHRAPRPRRRV